eukprot:7000894-Alexandrium_andersonii.AAC.1
MSLCRAKPAHLRCLPRQAYSSAQSSAGNRAASDLSSSFHILRAFRKYIWRSCSKASGSKGRPRTS